VFSEADYLQANSGFSWQSSIFFESCMSRSVIFIGLSFSDPNLRRWLGIMHQNRLRELRIIGHTGVASAPHYWFKTIPKTLKEKAWIEAAVAHLEVRLVWLKNWAEVGPALRNMLGLGTEESGALATGLASTNSDFLPIDDNFRKKAARKECSR
jgi:hypothetical protein